VSKPPASPAELAQQLAAAHRSTAQIEAPTAATMPADADAAYDVQHRTLAILRQPIAGWKVGFRSADGAIQCAPLRANRVFSSDVVLQRSDYAVLALELEFAFRFGRVFEPYSGPYSDAVVLDALSATLATIEVVSSRYTTWPAVHEFAQLADLLNHGALVFGDAAPYSASLPFAAPELSFTFNGASVVNGPVANPAGDPRRLLGWMVNHCVARGVAIGGDLLVTTGSYTGAHFPGTAGTAVGQIKGLPPVRVTLA